MKISVTFDDDDMSIAKFSSVEFSYGTGREDLAQAISTLLDSMGWIHSVVLGSVLEYEWQDDESVNANTFLGPLCPENRQALLDALMGESSPKNGATFDA